MSIGSSIVIYSERKLKLSFIYDILSDTVMYHFTVPQVYRHLKKKGNIAH
jgi:hypothetical protein